MTSRPTTSSSTATLALAALPEFVIGIGLALMLRDQLCSTSYRRCL